VLFRTSENINNGVPGSICQQTDGGLPDSPAPTNLSTNALGTLPGYYEVGLPADMSKAKGVMMVIHGGGWTVAGRPVVAALRGRAAAWRDRGWITVNTTYRACAPSADDVLAAFDATAAAYPDRPICISGESAGAHLALLIAARRPGVACVIGTGAPTALDQLGSETAYDPFTGGQQGKGPQLEQGWATAAFGASQLPALSPAEHAENLTAKVLLGVAAQDNLIPVAQQTLLRDAVLAADPARQVDVVVLPAGDTEWTHANVDRAAADDFNQRAILLAESVAFHPAGEPTPTTGSTAVGPGDAATSGGDGVPA
jgi:acetyl esterase/lipase